jgi:hypothetical protein
MTEDPKTKAEQALKAFAEVVATDDIDSSDAEYEEARNEYKEALEDLYRQNNEEISERMLEEQVKGDEVTFEHTSLIEGSYEVTTDEWDETLEVELGDYQS